MRRADHELPRHGSDPFSPFRLKHLDECDMPLMYGAGLPATKAGNREFQVGRVTPTLPVRCCSRKNDHLLDERGECRRRLVWRQGRVPEFAEEVLDPVARRLPGSWREAAGSCTAIPGTPGPRAGPRSRCSSCRATGPRSPRLQPAQLSDSFKTLGRISREAVANHTAASARWSEHPLRVPDEGW